MTGLKILFASILVLMSVSKCNEYSAEKTCNDAAQRGKIISVLMNNEKYLKEVIDSMKIKHGGEMTSASFMLMQRDKKVANEMMNNMMKMCRNDSSVCLLMMKHTIKMCDSSRSKCGMMLHCMKESQNTMKMMHEKGMCGMEKIEKKGNLKK